MKPTLFSVALVFVLLSCTEYQYLTVSGENISKNEKNEFISENDTVRVQYYFSDYKGKVGIKIYNKTPMPLEIDWKKSAVILDGKAYSYYNPNAAFSATVQDTLHGLSPSVQPGSSVYLGSVAGSIFIDEPSQFIPPASFVYKVPLALPLQPLTNLPEEAAKKESVKWATWQEAFTTTYKKMAFEKSVSPVQFRSYLTFRIGSGALQKEFSLEHRFFISEIWKTNSSPYNFPDSIIKRGDRFYLEP